MTKAHQDLETKTIELNAGLEKVKVREVTTQTVPKINKVSKVKQEDSEDNIKEENKEIHCRYFHKRKGCMQSNKCLFYHDENLKAKKECKNFKSNPIKKFKDELNIERKQEHDMI